VLVGSLNFLDIQFYYLHLFLSYLLVGLNSYDFVSYIDMMTENVKEIRERSFNKDGASTRDASCFFVKKDTKEKFLKMKSLLGENSSLMQKIPLYIKEHLNEEILKDRNHTDDERSETDDLAYFDEYWIEDSTSLLKE